MELEYQNTMELQPKGRCLGKVGYRPNSYIYGTILFGICFGALVRNLTGYIVGGAIIAMAVFYLLRVKDHPVMDVYQEDLVIYNAADPSQAARIPTEDITEFCAGDTKRLEILFRRKDGSVFSVSTAQTGKAYSLLEKAMSGRGTAEQNLATKKFGLFGR